VRWDGTIENENSPTYQEFNDNSSRTPSDDGNDGDDTSGGTASLVAQGEGYERPLSPFTADQFTHCTQDPDHDAPTSPTIPSSEANAPLDSFASSSQWIDDVPILGLIHIISQTFAVSNLPSGFMSGLIQSFIICITKTDKALLNGLTSHGRNTRHTFFEPKALCSCRRRSIMYCSMHSQYSGLFTCTMYDSHGVYLCTTYDSLDVYIHILWTICMYKFSR
jgi:hypothetical protein